MTAVSALPDDVLAVLLDAADEHRQAFTPKQRFQVVRLCAEAVAFSCDDLPTPPGLRARSGARLLLDLAFPDVDDRTLDQLSLACEHAAHRAPRAGHPRPGNV